MYFNYMYFILLDKVLHVLVFCFLKHFYLFLKIKYDHIYPPVHC